MCYTMRPFTLIILSILSLTTANGQTTADLKKINKTQVRASEDQQDINRLQIILTQQFLIQANNPKNKINKQIQDFFADYKTNSENLQEYNYPKLITKSNLTISVTGYDYTWGLLSSSNDTSQLNGYRNKMLNAIISIPFYDAYRRGYSINSISFNCKLTEVITWTETSYNKLPTEKLPTYKRHIDLEAKVLDLDD